MKKYLLTILCLFISSTLWAASPAMMAGVGSGAAAPTYLVNEGAEGGTTPAGWTDSAGSGTVNWNCTTGNGCPLVGSKSLLITGDNSGTFSTTTKAFTATNPVYIYFQYRPTDLDGVQDFFRVNDTGGTPIFYVSHTATNFYLRVWDGASRTTTDAFAVNTTYHLWIEYNKVGVGTSTIKIYKSTNGIKGTVSLDITDSSVNATAGGVTFESNYTQRYAFDHIIVSATSIGDSP
jgi:hypothetical protein